MAKSMLKPYNLLMYVLAFIGFFLLGILYANLTEAGKDQMLAGGAIVLGYGVIGAFLGFIVSLLVAYRSSRKTIIYINSFLTLAILLSFLYFTVSYQKRKQNKEPETEEVKKPTTAVSDSALLI